MTTETKTKRTRTMGTILVEHLVDAGTWRPILADKSGLVKAEHALEFDTTAAAEKWISDNGSDGATYRITREVLVVTVKTETVRKATLQKQA